MFTLNKLYTLTALSTLYALTALYTLYLQLNARGLDKYKPATVPPADCHRYILGGPIRKPIRNRM